LKKKVLENHPELLNLGQGQDAYKALEEALIEAWAELDLSLFQKLGESMLNRVKAVYEAQGWHTKY